MYDEYWQDDWSVDMEIEDTKILRADQRNRNHDKHHDEILLNKMTEEMKTNNEHQR